MSSHLIKIYGSKDKAIKASLSATGDTDVFSKYQVEVDQIYTQFGIARETDNTTLAHASVAKLAECYKGMFQLDNARNILLELADGYLQNEKLGEITDQQYGARSAEYIANAIRDYYGG